MLFMEIICICCEPPYVKHKYTAWQNVDFCNVTAGGTYSYHYALNQILCSDTPRAQSSWLSSLPYYHDTPVKI